MNSGFIHFNYPSCFICGELTRGILVIQLVYRAMGWLGVGFPVDHLTICTDVLNEPGLNAHVDYHHFHIMNQKTGYDGQTSNFL